MGKIKAVVFDMFNTLVEDGDSYWEQTFEHIVERQGLALSGKALRREWCLIDEQYRAKRGVVGWPFYTYREAWEKSFQAVYSNIGASCNVGDSIEVIVSDMVKRPLFPETLSALDSIGKKVNISLLSNADDVFLGPVVGRIGKTFGCVISSESSRCYKPNPKIFNDITQQLKLRPDQLLYVGDRQWEDVHGPKLCGMATAWINRDHVPKDPNLSEPDHIITSLCEVSKLIN